MAKRIKVDFDRKYDILYLGYNDCPKSYGVDIAENIVKFISFEDNTTTGIEITDYLSMINKNQIPSDVPFAELLNSEAVRNLTADGSPDTCFLTI